MVSSFKTQSYTVGVAVSMSARRPRLTLCVGVRLALAAVLSFGGGGGLERRRLFPGVHGYLRVLLHFVGAVCRQAVRLPIHALAVCGLGQLASQ